MDCLFCKIGSGEIASETVFEDADVRVFTDLHPKAPIHLLIIPKIHIQSVAHLEEHHAGVISHIIFTAKQMAEARGLKGFKLVCNVGREGGQLIDHLHLHLMGGWKTADVRTIDVCDILHNVHYDDSAIDT